MTADATTLPGTSTPSRNTLVVYVGALIAMFMASMDMQIVVTALPTIAGELGDLNLFGWVGAAYLLSTAAVTPFYGKLGDMYGRKVTTLTAITLFLIGSLACGLAWSMPALIGARVLQGLGGGGLMVSAFAIIGELFPPRERARYQGYSSAVFALSSILGPVLGGYITAVFGWRWIFLINLPVGIIVLVLLIVAMRSRQRATSHRLDVAGGLLLALASVTIVYWSDHILDPKGADIWSVVLPVVGILAIVGFVFVERRSPEPIIPLGLFRNSTVSIVAGVSVLAGACTLGMFFYFALYLQTLTGLTPAQVGLLFLPASASSLVVSILAGRMIAATGRYKWMPVAAMAIGALLMIGYTFVDRNTSLWVLGLSMAVFGVSMGLQMQVLMVAIQAAAPRSDIGAATGVVTQARTLGASLGLALNGAVMTWSLGRQTAELPADAATAVPGGLSQLDPALASGIAEPVRHTVLEHYSAGFNAVFWFVAALYVVALLLTLMLKDVQISNRDAAPAAE